MTMHLHIGLSEADYATLQRDLPVLKAISDGDSWEEWGEPLAYSPPGEARHVIIPSASHEEYGDISGFLAILSILVMQGEGGITLQPMRRPYQYGTIAVVTNAEVWSDTLYSLEDNRRSS